MDLLTTSEIKRIANEMRQPNRKIGVSILLLHGWIDTPATTPIWARNEFKRLTGIWLQ
jgi:hypothetical protein